MGCHESRTIRIGNGWEARVVAFQRSGYLPSLDQAAVRGVRRPSRPRESNENFIVAFLIEFFSSLLQAVVTSKRM